ncbi:hypothetical protein C8R45DRAFT_923844 [Mycena sanguinolenta]|nr:hypothetical protein C8R45DRAFT_923844 [Mycena sanguinolenta]
MGEYGGTLNLHVFAASWNAPVGIGQCKALDLRKPVDEPLINKIATKKEDIYSMSRARVERATSACTSLYPIADSAAIERERELEPRRGEGRGKPLNFRGKQSTGLEKRKKASREEVAQCLEPESNGQRLLALPHNSGRLATAVGSPEWEWEWARVTRHWLKANSNESPRGGEGPLSFRGQKHRFGVRTLRPSENPSYANRAEKRQIEESRVNEAKRGKFYFLVKKMLPKFAKITGLVPTRSNMQI